MKRIVISLCCAVLMIVTCCCIALPAFAENASDVNIWINAYGRPLDYTQYIRYEWSYVEPSPVEGADSFVKFYSSNHTMMINIISDQNSYNISSNDFRFLYSYSTIPEHFAIYTGTDLILRWSYANPDYVYIYVFQFWCQQFDLVSVEGSLWEFYSMFGDVTLTDFPQQAIGAGTGYEQGYEQGEQIGYDDGFSAGYSEGLTNGAGFDIDQVRQEGYNQGYTQAESDLLDSETWGGNFLGDIFSAPMIGLSQFVLFEAPNGIQVTLGGVVGAVIGMILLVTFLKFFAGG